MDKHAALTNLLQNQPDKLTFSVLSCGKVKLAGMEDLYTMDEVRELLRTRCMWREGSINEFVDELQQNKEASAPVDARMIPPMEKTAEENTGVVVDMYEVDYTPPDIEHSDQEIAKRIDLVNDYVSRMVFPDTTVSDIIVGPKEQIFKKKTIAPSPLPSTQQRTRASIWTAADDEYQYRDDYYKPKEQQGENPKVLHSTSIPEGLLSPDGKFHPAVGKGFGTHNALAMQLIREVPEVYSKLKMLLDIEPQTDHEYQIGVSLIALNYLLTHGWVRVNDATDAHYPTEQGNGIAFSGFDAQHVVRVAKNYLVSQPSTFGEVLIDIFQSNQTDVMEDEVNHISVQYQKVTGQPLPSTMQQWLREQEFAHVPTVVFQGSQEDFLSKYGSKSDSSWRKLADIVSQPVNITEAAKAENLLSQHFKAWAYTVSNSYPVQIYITHQNVAYVQTLMREHGINADVHSKALQ